MKTTLQSLRLFLVLTLTAITFVSCTKDEVDSLEVQNANSSSLERSLPPPTPGELRGFYDVKFSNGTEANMLFEYPNYVTIGTPTITDMLPIAGMRTNYSYFGTLHEFIVFDGVDYYNYRFNYNSTTAKFTGTYGHGVSYTNLGTFSGKKHFIGNSGFPLIKGYWLGSFGVGSGTPIYDYVMLFEENGKLSVSAYDTLNGSSPAVGTYTIIDNTVKGSYTYLTGGTYSFKFNFTNGSTTVNGTWGYGNSSSDGGSFSLSSQNFY